VVTTAKRWLKSGASLIFGSSPIPRSSRVLLSLIGQGGLPDGHFGEVLSDSVTEIQTDSPLIPSLYHRMARAIQRETEHLAGSLAGGQSHEDDHWGVWRCWSGDAFFSRVSVSRVSV
jgi:hypothetical protein